MLQPGPHSPMRCIPSKNFFLKKIRIKKKKYEEKMSLWACKHCGEDGLAQCACALLFDPPSQDVQQEIPQPHVSAPLPSKKIRCTRRRDITKSRQVRKDSGSTTRRQRRQARTLARNHKTDAVQSELSNGQSELLPMGAKD